jgi:threonylcarbamoyladenosine tRNA methylthiotransferase MtaB
MNKKVAFYTLGCKLNYSETSSIGRMFTQAGFDTVDFTDTPNVYVINTCSVTENADKKCKKIVKEALKISPNAFITIVGCYAQLKPKEIAEIPGVDMVLGAAEKFQLVDHITDLTKNLKPLFIISRFLKQTSLYHHTLWRPHPYFPESTGWL